MSLIAVSSLYFAPLSGYLVISNRLATPISPFASEIYASLYRHSCASDVVTRGIIPRDLVTDALRREPTRGFRRRSLSRYRGILTATDTSSSRSLNEVSLLAQLYTMSEARRRDVSLAMLQSYYPVVKTMGEYLGEIMDSPALGAILVRPTDSQFYQKFVMESYVALRACPEAVRPRLKLMESMVPMAEVGIFCGVHASPTFVDITVAHRTRSNEVTLKVQCATEFGEEAEHNYRGLSSSKYLPPPLMELLTPCSIRTTTFETVHSRVVAKKDPAYIMHTLIQSSHPYKAPNGNDYSKGT